MPEPISAPVHLNKMRSRARHDVEAFAAERGLNIVGTFIENESGAKLTSSELFRLIANSKPGDVLLIEQVDRLSRLTDADWRKLRADLDAKQIRVVASIFQQAGNWRRPQRISRRVCSPLSMRCCSICSQPWPAKTMTTAAAGKRKASRRRRPKANIPGAPKTQAATLGLLRCYAPVRHGWRSRPRSDAAERRSPRSPSERCRQPSTGPPRSQRRPPAADPAVPRAGRCGHSTRRAGPIPRKGSPFINAIERKAAKVVRERRANRAGRAPLQPAAAITHRQHHNYGN